MDVVQIERRAPVAWVWLNRPERLNAMDLETLNALRETFLALGVDEGVRAIVLAGRGRAFSSGFDIRWMAERTPDAVRADRAYLREVFDAIERCPLPLISAVQGDAMGGGLILTMVSDFVLAGEHARFGAPEVTLGVFPSLGLIPRLERLVGVRAAKGLVLTGRPADAQAACQMGLITAVVAAHTLYEEAQSLAAYLADLPPRATRATKAAFAAHAQADYVSWETEHAVDCWAAPERLDAMRRFLTRP